MKKVTISLLCIIFFNSPLFAQNYGWYTEGNFNPVTRIKVTLSNTLDFSRKDCPTVITFYDMPIKNITGNMIIVVDPEIPPLKEISAENKEMYRAHAFQPETNGHNIPYQLDDLDKDGIWDELFFMTDIGARETKTLYIYIGTHNRGPYRHETQAVIGNYLRRFVPFWESKKMLWKLFFPTDVDLMGKRNQLLTGYESLITNRSDYSMPYEQGSDIMLVGSTFGAGGICLFEEPAYPDSVSRPRFNAYRGKGQLDNTRYAFDVVVNGPLRSMIRAHIMNWRSGKGEYELEQYYTAYKNKCYYTCKVHYITLNPETDDIQFGCGIRKIMNEVEIGESEFIVKGGTIISSGANVSHGKLKVNFEAIALIVKDYYKPEYQFVNGFGGNHTFRIPVTKDKTFEYLVPAAWSEGMENTDEQQFRAYVLKEAQEYNNPLYITSLEVEKK